MPPLPPAPSPLHTRLSSHAARPSRANRLSMAMRTRDEILRGCELARLLEPQLDAVVELGQEARVAMLQSALQIAAIFNHATLLLRSEMAAPDKVSPSILPTSTLRSGVPSRQPPPRKGRRLRTAQAASTRRKPPRRQTVTAHSHKKFVLVPSDVGGNFPLHDLHSWRKYGQKKIMEAIHPRCYYCCTHLDCPARKRTQKTDSNPRLFKVTYLGAHTCSPSPLNDALGLPHSIMQHLQGSHSIIHANDSGGIELNSSLHLQSPPFRLPSSYPSSSLPSILNFSSLQPRAISSLPLQQLATPDLCTALTRDLRIEPASPLETQADALHHLGDLVPSRDSVSFDASYCRAEDLTAVTSQSSSPAMTYETAFGSEVICSKSSAATIHNISMRPSVECKPSAAFLPPSHVNLQEDEGRTSHGTLLEQLLEWEPQGVTQGAWLMEILKSSPSWLMEILKSSPSSNDSLCALEENLLGVDDMGLDDISS